jgi:hypothetical protein
LTQQYLTMDNPDLNGWLPDKGGIFYSADMAFYYQTFYKNPNADWRYVLGFEPAFMTDEDFAVYHSFLWNGGDAKSLKPWVDKMRPEDRLVVRGSRGSPPNIPQLEWNYGVSGTWIGRLPRHQRPPPLPTVPATEARTNFPKLQRSDSASNFFASAKSFSVKPPESCVVSASVTLFQRMSMSG